MKRIIYGLIIAVFGVLVGYAIIRDILSLKALAVCVVISSGVIFGGSEIYDGIWDIIENHRKKEKDDDKMPV